MWVDSENEPATFSWQRNSSPASNFISLLPQDSEDISSSHIWQSRESETSTPTLTTSNRIFNVSAQTRLSFSNEDTQMPLLEEHHQEDFSESFKHCHSQLSNQLNDSAWRRLLSTTLMCVFFMIAEVVGGHFAGSLAIMTDAAHLMSDLVGLLVSLSAVWLSQRPPTKVLSFGFHRAEVLGALFSIIVIWLLTGIFVYLATQRLLSGDFDIHPDRMMAVAAGGIVINIVMALVLHGGCHQFTVPHSHGFSHHQHLFEETHDHENESQQFSAHTNNDHPCNSEMHSVTFQSLNARRQPLPNKRSNINVRAAAIHVLGDLLQSIGVFVSAVVIKFNPDAKMADPICTFLFAIIVIFTTVPLLKDTGLILLEGCPPHLQYGQVLAFLRSVPGVHHVHSLHVWSLTVGTHVLAVHLAVDPSTDRDSVISLTQNLIARRFGIHHCTIQTELYNPTIMHTCIHCQPLVS